MTRRKAPTTTKKEPVLPAISSPDGSIALALSHLDDLFIKVQQSKIRAFDVSNITSIQSLKQSEIKDVNKALEITLSNLKDAIGGDKFFIEAYQQFNKSQMKLLVEYLKAVLKLKHNASSSKIRQKSIRKKKEKAPSMVVRKVLYLPKDPEANVESIAPESLVGAQQLWVYNAKTRKLGCYWAKNDVGLTAKGTTVLNYNEEKSTTKTLRKPKEQVWKFMSGGLKFWDSIKAVPQKISPRLSRETVLLKVA